MISGANISFISISLLALHSCRSELKVKCQCYTVGARYIVHCVLMVLLYNCSNAITNHNERVEYKKTISGANLPKFLWKWLYGIPQLYCRKIKLWLKIDILFGCDLLRLFLFKYHSQVIFLISFFFGGGGDVNWLRPKIYPPECDGLTLLHQEWLPFSIPIANNNPSLFDDHLQCPSMRPSNSEVASGRTV